MNEILEQTRAFVEEMNLSNSVLHKKEVLRRHPEVQKMLFYVYNPFKQFYVTSANIKKNSHLIATAENEDIFDLLDVLSTRVVTGHAALARINKFILDNKEYEDLIYKILDKDLECRVKADIINEIYPALIPTFSVALAESYKDVKDKVDLIKDGYYASRKLDGCRCIASIDEEGDITFLSREGREFHTLNVLKEELQKLNLKNVVFDGEICLLDDKGNETFQGIMSAILRKDYTIPTPKYLVFDFLTYDDFYNKTSSTTFSDRHKQLSSVLSVYTGSVIDVLKQTRIETAEQFVALSDEAKDKKWEGLILRKDTVYKGKRSRDLLKVKEMQEAEYIVKDIEVGPFRIVVDGVETTVETLSAVTIEHKGHQVSVGSGFTIEDRKKYYASPELIIGKEITVSYFEETVNKDGKPSLRFPIFKFNHGDRRSV